MKKHFISIVAALLVATAILLRHGGEREGGDRRSSETRVRAHPVSAPDKAKRDRAARSRRPTPATATPATPWRRKGEALSAVDCYEQMRRRQPGAPSLQEALQTFAGPEDRRLLEDSAWRSELAMMRSRLVTILADEHASRGEERQAAFVHALGQVERMTEEEVDREAWSRGVTPTPQEQEMLLHAAALHLEKPLR